MGPSSLRGYATFRHIDLSQGVRPFVPAAPQISLRELLGPLLPAVPTCFHVYWVDQSSLEAGWIVPSLDYSHQLQRTDTPGIASPWEDAVTYDHTQSGNSDDGYVIYVHFSPPTNHTSGLAVYGRVRAVNAVGASDWSELDSRKYVPPGPTPPPPPTIDFWATPTDPRGNDHKPGHLDAYVIIGTPAVLNWQVSNCNNCTISLQGKDDNGIVKLNIPRGLPSTGHVTVTPKMDNPWSQWIDYTLTVSGPNGSPSITRRVSIYYPSGHTQPAGSPFYFKCCASQSYALPCFTVGPFFASKLSDAVALVNAWMGQNGYTGYAATQISADQMATACG